MTNLVKGGYSVTLYLDRVDAMAQSRRKTKSVSQNKKPPTAKRSRSANSPANRLMGSVKIVGDLEESNRFIAELCKQAIDKSAKDLE